MGDVEALKRKLAEIQAILDSEPEPKTAVVADDSREPVASGPSEHCAVKFHGDRPEITVIVGTSELAEIPGLVDRISQIVHQSYSAAKKHKRLDTHDVMHRLEMGDAGVRANRVLHLAFHNGVNPLKTENLVGCCSSTFSPGWTEEGCGHWGILAVDPAKQGHGAGTALVLAAERRLATASETIQIEYQHTEGDEYSERLLAWYEGKLGFDGGRRGRPGESSFRRCLKPIPEHEQLLGQRRRLEEIRAWLLERLAKATEPALARVADSSEGDSSEGDSS